MTKQKVGLVLFWIGGIWAILWGVIGGISASSVMHSLTPAELNQSIWALEGTVFLLYGFSPALGGFVAGIGALLYTGAKGSTVWKFGIGIFIVFVIAMVLTQLRYLPPLFGVGGTLILLFFFGILWLWAKERMALKGSSTAAADYKLVGYVFMLMAAWFTCGIGSQPFFESLEGLDPMNPIHIMTFLVLGWLFLFLSHYKSRK
ncbi:hypothetical protein ACFLYF_03325 [Chloroflexota bacterium]